MVDVRNVDSRYRAAADLLDGYVHESRFLYRDQSPDHRIIWASRGFEAVFGCTIKEYNMRSIWAGFYHPHDAEEAKLRATRLRRGETVEAEVRLVRKNGDVRWLFVKNRPVFDSSTQEVVGVLGVGQDITRRKQIEESLRTHGIVLETMHEGVLVFDANDFVHFANKAAMEMFQCEAYVSTSIAASEFGLTLALKSDRTAAITEQMCRRMNGSEFLARVNYAQLELRGQSMTLAVLQDYTAQKQLEQAVIEIANREQQRIAVDLHDGLGQELAGAALMLRSLADKLAKGLPECNRQIEEIIALMNSSIQEVRTLARGLSPVELERGDLSAALSALSARTQHNFPIQVKFDCDSKTHSAIANDVANHLYRIAQEAVFNAARHSGCSRILIHLSQSNEGFKLTIEDDGCGVPQISDSPSGMGLRIMKYRAQMIGALVTFEAPRNGGTIVRCQNTRGATSREKIDEEVLWIHGRR